MIEMTGGFGGHFVWQAQYFGRPCDEVLKGCAGLSFVKLTTFLILDNGDDSVCTGNGTSFCENLTWAHAIFSWHFGAVLIETLCRSASAEFDIARSTLSAFFAWCRSQCRCEMVRILMSLAQPSRQL